MICTANGTLIKMLAEEDFRDNLFYMFRQSGITVPPLREMTEDIPDIADYLLSIYAHKTSQTRKRLDASAIKALKLYPWPGNIRELTAKNSDWRANRFNEIHNITPHRFQ